MKMSKDSDYKDRLRKLADKKARKKGKMDPEAMPGFKPRPFMEKIKNKDKSAKPEKMILTKKMRKNMPANMRKMKDK
jgi:hypothetical protein